MSRYFKFNDTNQTIVKIDNFNHSENYEAFEKKPALKVVFKVENEPVVFCLFYDNEEARTKDLDRLIKVLNRKEKLQ